jgi:hypothetical protein
MGKAFTAAHLFLLSFLLILSGCMTDRVQPVKEYPDVPKQGTFLVKKIEYDAYGRPLFREKIRMRPGGKGDLFALVHTVNNRPVRSYDIAVVEQQKSDKSPLEVIYAWTGRGYEAGMSSGRYIVGSVTVDARGGRGSGTIQIGGAIVTTVVLTATGFVVGLVASVPAAVEELRNVVVNARETVIGYTVYEYDEKNRIKFMKLFPPVEHAEALVKTEFFYEGESAAPYQAEVTSVIEKKVRLIR